MQMIINPNQVAQVYSGKPGCACGCKGNYSENPRTIKTIVNRMVRMIQDGQPPK